MASDSETKSNAGQSEAQQTQQSGERLHGSASQSSGTPAERQGNQQAGAVQQGGQRFQQGGQRSMARYGANPFALMQQVSEEMDQLFDSFFVGAPARRRTQQSPIPSLWVPDVEVNEQDNQLQVRVDLPGIPKENVKVEIEDGVLVVQGERREERSEGDERRGFRRTERRYGSFYRAIPLPEGVETDKAEAHMKDGVIEVRLPMNAQRQTRQLEIKE
jgi:HSP20 family protein